MNFEYSILYSKRKSISIIVDRDGSVIVRAPLNIREELIDQEIRKHKQSIISKIVHNKSFNLSSIKKEFVNGESIQFLGRNYQLYFVEDLLKGVIFDNKFFINKENKSKAKILLKEWYIISAKEIIIPKVRILAKQMGINYKDILIRDLKYRWGSCTSKKTLLINWRVIKAPMFVIEYIIIHELAHLIESNHSKKFWNIVMVQMPNYINAKKWLKEYGSELEKDF